MEVPHSALKNLQTALQDVGLSDNSLIQAALNQAQQSHRTQRRDNGDDYLEQHTYLVAISVIRYCQEQELELLSPELVAGAILHDVLEDDKTVTEVAFKAQFGETVCRIVQALSMPGKDRVPGNSEREKTLHENEVYIDHLRNAPREAQLIKLADNHNNLLSLPMASPKKVEKYLWETEQFYLPFAREVSPHYAEHIQAAVIVLRDLHRQSHGAAGFAA